uniref:Nucleotidyltransferase domain-containing protein n=1 Tax=Thermodesulfobacterium geofontis TaxID=1295609 RepID=A0A7V5XGE8_9BACT
MPVKIGLAEIRKKELENELKRLIPEIIKLDVEKIILFGSLISGDVHQTSDIDLIVIKKTDKKFLDRVDEFYDRLNPKVAIDIFVYTPEEFEEIKENNLFIKKALKEGIILYEKKQER